MTVWGRDIWPLLFLDVLGRSMSNVLFLSNPASGYLLLLALFYTSAYYATMALLGTIT